MEPVFNLSVVITENNIILVTWEESMLDEDGSYQLSFNISVTSTGVVLFTGEEEIAANSSMDIYSYIVPVEEGFIQPGVSVDVVAIACNSTNSTSPAVNASVSTTGGKE